MKITLSSNGLLAVNTINKLFSLGYRPQDIQVWYSENDTVLIDFCQKYDIGNLKIKDLNDFPKSINDDLLLSMCGTPLLIPDNVLDQFRFGGINLHPADTEKYRGRWMVSWCLINNEDTVSYTWHRMNNRYDTGNILLRESFAIGSNDTALSLNLKILNHAIGHLEQMLDLVSRPGCPPRTIGKYYSKQIPHGGMINLDWDLYQIDRFIRAMYYPPYDPAYLLKNGKTYYFTTIDDFESQKSLFIDND